MCPPLLDLLATYDVRASFFSVMGSDANLVEIVRLRLLADRSNKSPLNVTAKGGPARIAAAALIPRGVGRADPGLLRRIVAQGHELQPHGWSHIQWQRTIDAIDVDAHLRLALRHYAQILGRPATGFASPGRTFNDRALQAFDTAGLHYVGDMDGVAPFRPAGHRHLQLPITLFETIAQMRRRGLDDAAIVARYLSHIAEREHYCCLYEHPDDLGAGELRIFACVFAHLRPRVRPSAVAWHGTRDTRPDRRARPRVMVTRRMTSDSAAVGHEMTSDSAAVGHET